MSRVSFIGRVAATFCVGIGVFLTGAVLDQAAEPLSFRVALLPAWTQLILDMSLAAALVGVLARLGTKLWPLFLLTVLALPYLPVVPDRWPLLQVFAGPFKLIVWLSVSVLQGWELWRAGVISPGVRGGWLERRPMALVWIATVMIAGAAAGRLTGTSLFPGGDEPHYLVIMQSLWRDGDLAIENNHARGDYKEYFDANLDPHYHVRGTDGQIYSIHPVGMPVLMTPVYVVAGYRGVVLAMILIAATAAAMAWRWARSGVQQFSGAAVQQSRAAATFAWMAIVCSAPFLFNTFAVYPEIVAALAVMIALTVAQRGSDPKTGSDRLIGICCGALPWLSTKYAPMSAALMLVTLTRRGSRIRSLTPIRGLTPIVPIVIPFALSLLAWFAFFFVYWGSPLPSAPYGADSQTSIANVFVGVPGLLLDQEYGLLAYAPVCVFAALGLYLMWRDGHESRRRAIEIVIVFGALIGTVGAFDIWWGGSAAPGRPIASGLLLLMLPLAIAFRQAPAGSVLRAAQLVLVAVGAGIAGTLAIAEGGALIDNGRDGSSALLEHWSPRWPLWKLAPTFARAEPRGVDLSSRSRIAMLDSFDESIRPHGIAYNRLSFVNAAELPPRLSLVARPGLRTDPQPLRVIHNGRFALPAGSYRATITFAGNAASTALPLDLQVGRMGPPVQRFELPPSPNGQWQTTFELPVDVGFVGFRGPLETERAIAEITIAPVTIVDASARPRVPDVLASALYGSVSVYFHNLELNPEPNGFWTIGRREGRFTVAVKHGQPMPALRVHSGAAANRAVFRSGAWEQRLDMAPGRQYDVALPADADGVSTIEVTTTSGFSPRQVDAASKDERFLGIWIEVLRRD
jgi:hypothetical protein